MLVGKRERALWCIAGMELDSAIPRRKWAFASGRGLSSVPSAALSSLLVTHSLSVFGRAMSQRAKETTEKVSTQSPTPNGAIHRVTSPTPTALLQPTCARQCHVADEEPPTTPKDL